MQRVASDTINYTHAVYIHSPYFSLAQSYLGRLIEEQSKVDSKPTCPFLRSFVTIKSLQEVVCHMQDVNVHHHAHTSHFCGFFVTFLSAVSKKPALLL